MDEVYSAGVAYNDQTFLDDLFFALWLRNDDCEITFYKDSKKVETFRGSTYEEGSDLAFECKWTLCRDCKIEIEYDEAHIPYTATITKKRK